MRKRAGLNSTAWMRIKLGSNTERREKNSFLSVTTSPLKLYFLGATSPKFPPEANNKSESGESEHTEAENRQIKRWRASKGRLTLDFVGVGLLAPRHRGEDDDGGGVDDDDDVDDERR